jgi:hypothetical protein
MTAQEIRKAYLEFFEKRGRAVFSIRIWYGASPEVNQS